MGRAKNKFTALHIFFIFFFGFLFNGIALTAQEEIPTLLDPFSLEQELTQHYINQYSSPGGLQWLSTIMSRGGPYLAFISAMIEELNLPPELLYLPVVESQFIASAVSRAGAAGLWQFMRNSIAPYDMVVNEWIDERRDFWKSTRGALLKLQENYNYFGDWPLALAAYNAGLGAVSRAVNSAGVKDYWYLCENKYLRTETIHYVPKLLAVSHILGNPYEYGYSPIEADDPGWVRIPVPRSVDLNMLAREAGIDAEALKWANRELLHAITPPGSRYLLKIRADEAERAEEVLARTDLPLIRYYVHTIKSGDTLLALAIHYGVSVEQILELNPGTSARALQLGRNLMVPALRETGPYVARPPASGLSFTGSYSVKNGDTLWSLSLLWEVPPESIAEANGMGLNDILREGRVIKMPIRE